MARYTKNLHPKISALIAKVFFSNYNEYKKSDFPSDVDIISMGLTGRFSSLRNPKIIFEPNKNQNFPGTYRIKASKLFRTLFDNYDLSFKIFKINTFLLFTYIVIQCVS